MAGNRGNPLIERSFQTLLKEMQVMDLKVLAYGMIATGYLILVIQLLWI